MSTLLNITSKVDPNTLTVLQSVADSARILGIPFFIIGATARDMVLHHYYGARISRATHDLDFAIQVPDWSAFEALKSRLVEAGFTQASTAHRLNTILGGWIDLVPFGPVSNDGKSITWPPKGDLVMNVLGFSEAFEDVLQVRISDSPIIDIPVVSPVGLTLLKLISWTDRETDKRPNDAKDLIYLCENYHEIPAVADAMYSDEEMMEAYDWNPERGSANMLGRGVRRISSAEAHVHLEHLFNGEIQYRPIKILIQESCTVGVISSKYEEHQAILDAFIAGYRN